MSNPINAYIFYGNNETSIILIKNAKSQSSTKHINVQHYYVEKLVIDNKFIVKKVCNANMLANSITKALIIDNFHQYQFLLELSN